MDDITYQILAALQALEGGFSTDIQRVLETQNTRVTGTFVQHVHRLRNQDLIDSTMKFPEGETKAVPFYRLTPKGLETLARERRKRNPFPTFKALFGTRR